MSTAVGNEQAYTLGYDDGYENAGETGEAPLEDWDTYLLDGGTREAIDYLGEDPDLGLTDAVSEKLTEYVRGAQDGSAAAVAKLREEQGRYLFAVVGLPGESAFDWRRFEAYEQIEAQSWLDARWREIMDDNRARGSLSYRLIPGSHAFDMRWQDGRRIYWGGEDEQE